ncbi:tetratricopeptide repeat protein [Paraferrimonas sedimenticola]|nr:tetratricopeptide repeat protein [Paraferrimonas sedimenticola]
MAETRWHAGDANKAIYFYVKALELDPENPAILTRIAEIHRELGNLDIATKAYQDALLLKPDSIEITAALGVLYAQKPNINLAKEHLNKAIALDQARIKGYAQSRSNMLQPLDAESPVAAYNAYAILKDSKGEHLVAREYFFASLQQQPDDPLLLTNLGYSFYLSGKLGPAERYFRQALRYDNHFARAWTNLGLIYARKGQYPRAIQALKQVVSEADAYNDLGYILMLDGKFEEAEEMLNMAIKLSPKYFAKAHANLEKLKLEQADLANR